MKSKTMMAVAMLVGLSASPVLASGGELVSWGTSGGWDILVDPTLNNSCLMQADYQNGSTVRIGLDKSAGGAYLDFFNAKWGDIKDGASYQVSFDVDGNTYKGTATGMYLGGEPGVDIVFDNMNFADDIAQGHTLTAYDGSGNEVMAIDLTGTNNAMNAVLACQDKQGN